MVRKLLLFLSIGSLAVSADAQRKSQKQTTAYAITGMQKGNSNWTEVKLIDVNTGEVLKSIYTNKDEVQPLNARTRKPIAKKEMAKSDMNETIINGYRTAPSNALTENKAYTGKPDAVKAYSITVEKTVDGKKAIEATSIERSKEKMVYTFEGKDILVTQPGVNVNTDVNNKVVHRVIFTRNADLLDKPFSTTSAAAAYDKKHERLYYTPIGINELRYIDLKSKSSTIFYFENEAFGALSNRHDVPNQITRMVIAGDGDGYALTNNARHLIKFTTNKKAVITDLGELTNDPANGRYSVHSSSGYGGDIVADNKDNIYLITASKTVFKISLKTKVASYIGTIKGLPREFSTNGAVVGDDNSIVVSSANSTLGYYRFNLESLVAERASAEGSVYNASDLANANLLSTKKEKEEKKEEPIVDKPVVNNVASETINPVEEMVQNKVSVYPNPVAMGGVMKLNFKDQPSGNYTVQFMDIAGKLISSRQVNISSRSQVEEYELPELTARGNYLLKVVSDAKKLVSVNKIVVQ